MNKFFLFTFGLLLSSWVNAQDYQYKGIAPNDSVEKVSKLLDFDCRSMLNKYQKLEGSCSKKYTSKIKATLAGFNSDDPYIRLLDDRVGIILVGFNPDYFNGVLSALVEKYGKPAKVEKNKVTTSGGLEYENEVDIWETKDLKMELKKYSTSIKSSNFSIYSKAFIEKIEANDKEAAKINAKDL